jgi:cytochrome c oxidase subunit 2
MKRQLEHFKQGIRGGNPEDALGASMVGMAATLPTAEAVNNVLAHIETLPDTPAAHTINGDTKRGKKLYETCMYCHGMEAQGVWSTNAPRLAGMNDWYLVRQLDNFKKGVRGSHEMDAFGPQMKMMARVLRDDKAVTDLVAYINTLD